MDKIQYRINTFPRREEDLFRSAKARLDQTKAGRRLRVLSFGCSIGDEVASLCSIFPGAEIVGCDVDDAALEAAQRTVGHMATILRSDAEALAALGPFDFIAACSVLCLNPRPKDFAARFPAVRFDEAVARLDALLAEGGVLGLTNASYRFLESPAAAGYDIVRSDIVASCGFIDVMSRDGTPMLLQTAAPASPFYRAGEAFNRLDDEDFADALFEKRGRSAPRHVHWVHLAPVPDDWRMVSSYERENVDGMGSDTPADAIRMTTRYELGFREGDGQQGIVSQTRWPAIAGGFHLRPRTYAPLGAAAIRRISRQ